MRRYEDAAGLEQEKSTEMVSAPHPTTGLGSVVRSQRGPRRASTDNDFWCILSLREHIWWIGDVTLHDLVCVCEQLCNIIKISEVPIAPNEFSDTQIVEWYTL